MTDLWNEALWAIRCGNFEKFYQLTKDQVDIFKLKNENCDTLLHLVAANVNAQADGYEYDYIPFIKYLLEQGAAVNAKNDKDQTPLDLSVTFGCSSAATYLLKNEAKAGNIDIEQLASLLFSVVWEVIDNPQDYEHTQYEKLKLVHGAHDAYNKYHENISTHPDSLAIPSQNERAQINVKERKGKIEKYIHQFKSDIISHCTTDASLSLLHATGFKCADNCIASHLADFIPNQDMFSIFQVNKDTYAPLKAYLNPDNKDPIDQLEDLAAAVGSSALTDELVS